MRTPCPLCGSVACMLLSPAFCRTTRQNRAAGTAPVMPASVIVRQRAESAPAVEDAPSAPPTPDRRPSGRTRGSNR